MHEASEAVRVGRCCRQACDPDSNPIEGPAAVVDHDVRRLKAYRAQEGEAAASK
jgi:hypothetical protein